MTGLYILGDSGTRQTNYDPKLADRLNKEAELESKRRAELESKRGKAEAVNNKEKNISPPQPEINVPTAATIDDYVILENIICTDADGNIFERYDKIYVKKDMEKDNAGNALHFIPYDAVVHLEEKRLLLPSFALTCNILEELYRNKSNPDIEKVLQQYNAGWHAQNSIIDFNTEQIIHYPTTQDYDKRQKAVNAGRTKTTLNFKKATLQDELFENALREEAEKRYVQQLTGLQNPYVMIEIGNYFGKPIKLWFPWRGQNGECFTEKRAAWLGCSYCSFNLGANSNFYYSDAARGVLLNAP